MEIRRGAQTLIGYPALVDRGDSVSLEVLDSAGQGARGCTAPACGGCSCCS